MPWVKRRSPRPGSRSPLPPNARQNEPGPIARRKEDGMECAVRGRHEQRRMASKRERCAAKWTDGATKSINTANSLARLDCVNHRSSNDCLLHSVSATQERAAAGWVASREILVGWLCGDNASRSSVGAPSAASTPKFQRPLLPVFNFEATKRHSCIGHQRRRACRGGAGHLCC